MTQKHKPLALQPGWAIYLRTSDEGDQNAQERQRHSIERTLLQHSDLPVIDVYIDIESGINPNRPEYQRLLRDARAGKFSCIAVDDVDRFGRNHLEAIQRHHELVELGISVQFANPLGLPTDKGVSDDFLLHIVLSYGQFESAKASERTRKRQSIPPASPESPNPLPQSTPTSPKEQDDDQEA